MEEGTAVAFGLFGREEELRLFSETLTLGGSAVAVGEPGVGKSSLLKVAHQLAQRRGRRVLAVSPTQFERELPFAGLAELMSQVPEDTDNVLPGPQRHALAVALQRAEPHGPNADPLAVPLAVRGLLSHLCNVEPVAVIIDDLQWMDPATIGSLGFALRRLSIASERLSVLVGTRSEGASTDLIRSLGEPRREFSLTALENPAIGQLLRKRFGHRWTPPMSDAVARASDGNPLLALTIAQAVEAGALTWGVTAPGHDPVLPVPPSLADLLRQRTALLAPDTREVLLLVSSAGRMTVTQLERIVGESRLRDALGAAADADVAGVGAETMVTFTHPMLASAIYDAAGPAERRHAHRLLAEGLDDPVERARHRSRAITAPDEEVARELEEAAEIAFARAAPALAGELLESAALATPSAADSPTTFRRQLLSTGAYLGAGDLVAANTALDRAAVVAVWPEQKAQVVAHRLWVTELDAVEPQQVEHALQIAPIGSEVRVELMTTLSARYRTYGNREDALRLARSAIEEAPAVKRFDLQLSALTERRTIEEQWGEGDRQKTLNEIDELIDTAGAELHPVALAWTRGFYATWADTGAEAQVRGAITASVEAGQYGNLSQMYIALVLLLIRASRVHDARAALEESDRIGAWTTSSYQEDMARTLVNEYAGDLDEARKVAQLAAVRGSKMPYWSAGFLSQVGFIETSARNWDAALVALREVAEIFDHTKMIDLEQLLWPIDYADAALQVGALDEVEVAIRFLRRQGAWVRPEALVAADRCGALLKAARGDVDDALHDLVRIVELSAAECPFEAARSRLALGQVYRRAGYRRMANDALEEVADTFELLGVTRWAERALDEASRTGLHPTTSTLTEAERRVAELVASGHSNQETAAALFMSVKTVEANLTRIYRKLSVRSRTELANRMSAHD